MTDPVPHPQEQTVAEAARQGPHPMRKYIWLVALIVVIGGSVGTWSLTHKTAPPQTLPGVLGN